MPQELDKPYLGGLELLGQSVNPFKNFNGSPHPAFAEDIAAKASNMDSTTLLKYISILEKGNGFLGGSKFDMVAHEILKQELESRRPLVQGSGLLGGR